MAVFDLRNPSGLYTGGSAVFNPHDYTAIAQAARNRKAAKDEAIDNYYKNLPNTLNDKGVRDVDIPTIAKAKDVLQQYWAQNKDAIRKGNTPQALELQKRFREIGDLVNQSKSRAQTDLQLGKERLSGKSDYIFSNPDFITKLSAHNLPVAAPGSQGIDIATDFTGPQPFDENKYRKNFSDIKYNEGVPEISEHPTDKYLMVKTPTYNLGDDAKKVIYERAADAYHNNPVFKRKIDVDLAGTDQLPRLMGISQKTFGKPIETPEDLAAAYTVSQLPTPQVKPTTIPNWDTINAEKLAKQKQLMADRNAEWDRRNKITFGQSLAKIRANKQAQQTVDTPYLTDEYFDRYGKQLTNEEQQAVINIAGFAPVGYIDAKDIHPNDYNTITGRDLTKKVLGVKPLTVGDRTVFLVDKNGDWVGENNARINRETVRNVNIEKRVNTKAKAQMEQNKKQFTPTVPASNKPNKWSKYQVNK